jgi:transcriptional regulator with XRE-family HTH domain
LQSSNFTIVEFESGMNRTYLSAVEQAERNVSIDNIARIAKGLRVEPWKLIKNE